MDPESYGIELESAYFSEEDIAANQSPSPPFSPARRIEETEVDVAIIGNGPSAIMLSLLLSGRHPHLPDEHPNPILNVKLQYLNKESNPSLLEQDLQFLSEGLEGRSNNPLSLLFDTLFHPNADIGENHASTLSWSYVPSRACSHVVLGKSRPGGSWHAMKPSTVTLSLSQWLELPLYSFDSWKKGRVIGKDAQMDDSCTFDNLRASAGDVAEYYSSYVSQLNLEKNFECGVTVVKVEDLSTKMGCQFTEMELWKRCTNIDCLEDGGICCLEEYNPRAEKETDQKYKWRVTSCDKERKLVVKAKKLVLACGLGQPNRLGVNGENLPFVIHSVTELQGRLPHISAVGKSIVIVGAGISAADAILAALERNIHVIHVFRQKSTSETLLLNKLPKTYQEYHHMRSLMTGQIQSHLYTPLEQHIVEGFTQDCHCHVRGTNGHQSKLNISTAVVLIGSHADLDFLPPHLRASLGYQADKFIDSTTNMIDIDLFTSQSEKCSDLYALGPLVGDNFVRFVFGSALGSAQNILALK